MASVYETVTFGVPAYHVKDAASKRGGLSVQRTLLGDLSADTMTSSYVDEWIRAVCADVVHSVPIPAGLDAPPLPPPPPADLDKPVDSASLLPMSYDSMSMFENAFSMQFREDIVLAQVCMCICTWLQIEKSCSFCGYM